MNMQRTTFSILFYIKKSKLLKDGTAPIYMRITINRERSEISIKRRVQPLNWDTARNKAKGKMLDVKDLNDYLTSIRGQLFQYQQDLQESGKVVSAKSLSNAFLGIGERQWNLVELFQDHNDNMEKLVGKDYAPLTLQRYKSAIAHIKIYCKSQYNNIDLSLSEINNKFITGFEFYLKTTANCQHNSAMKHIKALKKVIRIALANDYLRKDPFCNYQITQKKVDRECLTEIELKRLTQKEITIERLAVIRDLFVFQCYTGLAYKDLASLSKEHIQIGMDGKNWIIMKRGKTGVTCRIPLLPISEKIIEKYSENPIVQIKGRLLPVPSNQKMNAYLKELATICEIDKDICSHLGRHTFGSTVTLSNGIPIETVSKMLGHTKILTTQIYAKVLDTKISEDMNLLRKKME
jgi:site-specific recombinase XerD